MLGAILGFAGVAAGLAVGGSIAWAAWVLAGRLLASVPPRERAVGAAVLGLWGCYAIGRLLLAAHLFTWWSAIAVAGLFAYLAWRRRTAADRIALPAWPRSWWTVGAIATAALLVVRTLKGLSSPPLGWDAITYHLFKAGRFAGLGSAPFEAAPDGWGYYEHFPAAGSVLWGWTFLFSRDGGLLAPAGLLVAVIAAGAGYALARRLGAERAPAALAALVLAATPALTSQLTAGYVDTLVVAAITASLVLAPLPGDSDRWGRAVLAGAACGLAAAAKTSAVPAVVALTGAIGIRALSPAVACAAAAVVTALPEYLGPWIRTGNPLYPFGLRMGGRELLHGYEPLMTLLSGRSPMHDVSGYPGWEIFAWLGGWWRWPNTDYSGLGVGAGLVALLAVAGVASALRDRATRLRLLVPACVAALLATAAWSPDSLALRTLWASVFGRHLLPIWAVVLALAALVPWRWSRWIWAASLASSLGMSLPRGFGSADAWATGELAIALAAGVAFASRVKRGPLAVAAVVFPLALVLAPVREGARYEIWKEAAETTHGPFDYHPLDPDAIAAWPMWKQLDATASSRIAVTCGWNGVSQSWYLHPLLGSRLQHEVIYVPPTIDGSVVDYSNPDAMNRKAQLRGYLRNLLARGVDRIVVLHPAPPEHGAWIVRLPEVFVPEWEDAEHDNHLYRFDRERARAMVEAP